MLAKPDELLELLCHRWDAVVNMALAHEQGTHRYRTLAHACQGEKAHILSFREEWNDRHLVPPNPWDIDPGLPVLYCFDSGRAYFKSESDPKALEFYLERR